DQLDQELEWRIVVVAVIVAMFMAVIMAVGVIVRMAVIVIMIVVVMITVVGMPVFVDRLDARGHRDIRDRLRVQLLSQEQHDGCSSQREQRNEPDQFEKVHGAPTTSTNRFHPPERFLYYGRARSKCPAPQPPPPRRR